MKTLLFNGMNNPIKLLLLSILAIATLTHCDREDPEITDFAYPPEDMLRYYDFPEGSWWAYLCINDSTVDTLKYISVSISDIQKDRTTDVYYKSIGYKFYYKSLNGTFSLDTSIYSIRPFNLGVSETDSKHRYFFCRLNPTRGQFNPHEELFYPIEDSLYTEPLNNYRYIKDSIISFYQYPEILQINEVWMDPTIPVFIEDKFLVKDIGLVKFTLNNGYTYELIQYSIN